MLKDGAKKAVHHERIDDSFPKTIIVKKQIEHCRALSHDTLGKGRNHGQSHTHRADFTHGIKNDLNAWNAGKCINGEGIARMMAPDSDLGKSCKPNSSNNVRRPEDKDRAFGLPTVRSDIPYKTFKSVADWRNFGDEPEAVDLLYPNTNLEQGITELDF